MFRPFLLTLALAGSPLLLVPVATAQTTAARALDGDWRWTLDTPRGPQGGVLRTATDAAGALQISMSSDANENAFAPVRGLVRTDDRVMFVLSRDDIGDMDVALTFADSTFQGTLSVQGYAMPLAGRRLTWATTASPAYGSATPAPTSVAGTWSYALETPNGATSGTIELSATASGTLSGRIVRANGEVSELSSATLDGDVLTLVYPSARYGAMTMRLTVSGGALAGALLVGQTEMPVRATRLLP